MSIKIKWDVNAAGRSVGDEETVELTEFVQGVINGGYAHEIPNDEPEQAEAPHSYPEPAVEAPAIVGVVQAEPEDAPKTEEAADEPSSDQSGSTS